MVFEFVSGVVQITKLQEVADTRKLRNFRLPNDIRTSRDAIVRCFKTCIRTNNNDLIPGIICFPHYLTSNEHVVPPDDLHILARITGLLSHGSNDRLEFKYLITATSFIREEVLDSSVIGSLSVVAVGLCRRIIDENHEDPPVFEFYLRNKCAHKRPTTALKIFFYRVPAVRILDSTAEANFADDFLVPCALFGTFETLTPYESIMIRVSAAKMHFLDLPDLDISDYGSIPATKLDDAFSAILSFGAPQTSLA